MNIISIEDIKRRILESNKSAKENRNLYPIQEQATLLEIWEYVPCECNNDCTCKNFGCTNHYKLKKDTTRDDLLHGFLRMFVDNKKHEILIQSIKENPKIEPPKRVKGAKQAFELFSNWAPEASDFNKILICTEWVKLKEIFNKIPVMISVYYSKMLSILFPDICVPYDTDSRQKIIKELGGSVENYFDMLNKLRMWLLNILEREHILLKELRELDNCDEILPFNPGKVSLPKIGFNYGSSYEPKERPISRIIDKYFYNPGKSESIDKFYSGMTPQDIKINENKKEEINYNFSSISNELIQKAISKVENRYGNLPFQHRGIKISKELIQVTMEILNSEPGKVLPQNCRNDIKDRTPDGLDRRIKERLNTDLRTANIISDILKEVGIVEIITMKNSGTKRIVKGTRLLPDWCC